MTLKEELEILRGEPIEVFAGDPMDIPCIETSDPDKLCKHPVVSVHMITYNHEPYIRQAIESVMMQKTDFEFELVIGEDASTDKTREICFEYQKKYPDKIRVLWWHENVSKLGGNGRRCRARCRGEFIAFCEGDDYWIDPLKLQKQVDVMRKHPNVGFCFGDAIYVYEDCSFARNWSDAKVFPSEEFSGAEFCLRHIIGNDPVRLPGPEGFIMTASALVRCSALKKAVEVHDIFRWKLALGDKQLFLGIASVADVYYIDEKLSAYRQNPTGAMSTAGDRVKRDAIIVRMYFLKKVFGLEPRQITEICRTRLVYFKYCLYGFVEIMDIRSFAAWIFANLIPGKKIRNYMVWRSLYWRRSFSASAEVLSLYQCTRRI